MTLLFKNLMHGDKNARADAIGWTLMLVLGGAFLAILALKVMHASERDKVGKAMLDSYKVTHQCVLVARPSQNQPQRVKCDNGETTEHLLRKKAIGNTWQ